VLLVKADAVTTKFVLGVIVSVAVVVPNIAPPVLPETVAEDDIVQLVNAIVNLDFLL
jgi:hypothetical protein